MNPLGLPFEMYDGIFGRYRTAERLELTRSTCVKKVKDKVRSSRAICTTIYKTLPIARRAILEGRGTGSSMVRVRRRAILIDRRAQSERVAID